MTSITTIKERPWDAYPHEIKAIFEGRQTQFRRVIKPQPGWHAHDGQLAFDDRVNKGIKCPYGKPGERLWVREAWLKYCELYYYKSTDKGADIPDSLHQLGGPKWKPSIHMPRAASRITLDVKRLWVERLQDISEEDAWAEGCKKGVPTDNNGFFPADEPDPSGIGDRGWDCAKDWFADLWDFINAKRGNGWDENPWVWCIEFELMGGAS